MLRVGVIGCGSIAKQRHGYEYFQNANVEIKGFFRQAAGARGGADGAFTAGGCMPR